MMLQDVDIAEGDALNDVSVMLMIAMGTDVGGMGYICPKCAVLYQHIPAVTPMSPAAAVNGNAVVRCTQEAAVHMDIAATHHVDTITPALTGNRTDTSIVTSSQLPK